MWSGAIRVINLHINSRGYSRLFEYSQRMWGARAARGVYCGSTEECSANRPPHGLVPCIPTKPRDCILHQYAASMVRCGSGASTSASRVRRVGGEGLLIFLLNLLGPPLAAPPLPHPASEESGRGRGGQPPLMGRRGGSESPG